jgi:hypothetical protein
MPAGRGGEWNAVPSSGLTVKYCASKLRRTNPLTFDIWVHPNPRIYWGSTQLTCRERSSYVAQHLSLRRTDPFCQTWTGAIHEGRPQIFQGLLRRGRCHERFRVVVIIEVREEELSLHEPNPTFQLDMGSTHFSLLLSHLDVLSPLLPLFCPYVLSVRFGGLRLTPSGAWEVTNLITRFLSGVLGIRTSA